MKLYPKSLIQEVEFDFIRQRTAAHAVTAFAKQQLLELLPFHTQEDARLALTEVNELVQLYAEDYSVPALSAAEVDEHLLRLKMQNAVLEPEACMDIKELVETFNRLYIFFNKHRLFTPHVTLHFAASEKNDAIPEAIDRVFDRKGEVKTSASDELRRIRHQLSRKRAAADRLFYKVAKKYETAGILGQIHESVHEDRRVLAINASYKSRAKGIFHGSSSKHSLYYIEPQETIEVNNEIAMLLDEERIEIKRILKELTRFIANYREELIDFTRIIRQIDFIHAKARMAIKEEACLPTLSPQPAVDIIDGINPVLRHFNGLKKKPVVPLEAKIEENQRIIVISGPNAGGKSITLKTIGLLQLMIQSGLLVPVNARSTFGWFSQLMGDIGDAQNIENELSTYSAKLNKMSHFLEKADDHSLVLIDEFGSGSDPELGSALAQVFLEELNQAGARAVLTTHYNSIKALAGGLEGVKNGSMAFNSKTFSPEYTLLIGTPGSSYTFEVAKRVGITKRLIERAKQKLDDRTVDIDKLLVDVQREKNHLSEARAKLHARLQELNDLKNKQTGKIANLETQLEKLRKSAEENQDVLMWGNRFESLVKSYVKNKTAKGRKEVMQRMLKLLGEHAGEIEQTQKKEATKTNKKKAARLKRLISEEIVLGDKVKLIGTRQKGTVEQIRKDKYLIAFGGNISSWVERPKFIKEGKRY